MSAFILSAKHIDTMLSGALALGSLGQFKYGRLPLTEETATEIGRGLMRENYNSVNYRYEGDPEVGYIPPSYTFTRQPMPDTNVDAVALVGKSFACYDYQTCEHAAWEDSDAFSFCNQVLSALREAYGDLHNLAAYDAAPWGVK